MTRVVPFDTSVACQNKVQIMQKTKANKNLSQAKAQLTREWHNNKPITGLL